MSSIDRRWPSPYDRGAPQRSRSEARPGARARWVCVSTSQRQSAGVSPFRWSEGRDPLSSRKRYTSRWHANPDPRSHSLEGGGSPEAGAAAVDLDLEFAELASPEGGPPCSRPLQASSETEGWLRKKALSAHEHEGPQKTEARRYSTSFGAEAGTRTPMSVRPLRPERAS